VHVDVKKFGRIPAGGGHRTLGRQAGRKNRRPGIGYAFLHSAVDDHPRLVYSEILTNEKRETAAGFWERANALYAANGIIVLRVMTDNGSCYLSTPFKTALGDVAHKFTRPHRPQANGKIGRFRTLDSKWANARHYGLDAFTTSMGRTSSAYPHEAVIAKF
jgi:transposase InsO family protein